MKEFEEFIRLAGQEKGRKLRVESSEGTSVLFENTGSSVLMYLGNKPLAHFRAEGSGFKAEPHASVPRDAWTCYQECVDACGPNLICAHQCATKCGIT